jgi:hypothetical protein
MGRMITLASFVYNDKIESFKKYLNKRFDIHIKNIFEYDYGEPNKVILTFRLKLDEDQKVDINSFFPPTIIVHKKGECFYTINALNKLIESLYDVQSGNVNYSDFNINWDDYQNNFIIIFSKELKILDIKRNFS